MGPDPDPTLDPSPFLSDLSMEKNYFFHIFFLITNPQAHYRQSKNLIFCKVFVLKFFFASITSDRSTFYEKREGSGSGFIPLTNGSGSLRPKNMRIRIS
jgi:hypothetical protein